MTDDKKPIYDDKVTALLQGLMQGKSRSEMATELGYNNEKSLDIYIRRRNFRWDRAKKTYTPITNTDKKVDELPSSSKVATIISLFKKEGADPKTIAKRLGFQNHLDLAAYMTSKNYIYNANDNNYVKQIGEVKHTEIIDTPVAPKVVQADEYHEILEILKNNKNRLIDLLMPQVESGRIPRYTVGGTFLTKSVHMSNKLDQMIKDFSVEKAITQREIFEVSLLEFFRRYGYEREVNIMLEE